MNTLDYMLKKHGPLMSMDDVADLFDRKSEGLRVSLADKKKDCEFTKSLNAAKKKIGHRVYFITWKIVEIIDVDD